MWFVILKTWRYRKIQVPGQRSRKMLLVADDAKTAYSNPRPLPKCAQTLLPCIRLAYRTPRCPNDAAA